MKADCLMFTPQHGSGKITAHFVTNRRYRLVRLELHLDSAPTTSENFTITTKRREHTIYDTVLYKRDLSVGSVTDLVILFGEKYEYDRHDEIVLAYTNTDGNNFGARIVTELLED